jgi:hypothetical protein
MTTAPDTTCITQIATVFVPVSNQDQALEFYLDKLGFEKRVDFTYGGIHRWIEVAPPGSTNSIALVPPSEGKSAGGSSQLRSSWKILCRRSFSFATLTETAF